MNKRNKVEVEQFFRLLDIDIYEQWMDEPRSAQKYKAPELIDKIQKIDPLCGFYTEVQQPHRLKEIVRKWRTGAEIRFKMPYYPETKKSEKTFSYI